MFEKEAEEYSNNWKINKNNDLNFAELVELRAVIYKANKDGAEFGYNKVNEWHYVEDETPPTEKLLLVCTIGKNGEKRCWESNYTPYCNGSWSGSFNKYIDKPYAWKEIVLPELPKESE